MAQPPGGDDDEPHAPPAGEVQHALRNYWAPIFTAKATCAASATELAEAHIPALATDAMHPPTADLVRRALSHSHDTAPGPDGLPYSALRGGGHTIHIVLARMLHDAAQGRGYPGAYHDTIAVCVLPKGAAPADERPRAAEIARHPTRGHRP